MLEEYGLKYKDCINCGFIYSMEKEVNKLKINRILTIKEAKNELYIMEELPFWAWSNKMIECLAKDYIEPEPITSRFEILDL